MSKNTQHKVECILKEDRDRLQALDQVCLTNWGTFQERRLAIEEIAKLIDAGPDDLELILSPNTNDYWLYSNAIDAYCNIGAWYGKDEAHLKECIAKGVHLYPLITWVFGEIDL